MADERYQNRPESTSPKSEQECLEACESNSETLEGQAIASTGRPAVASDAAFTSESMVNDTLPDIHATETAKDKLRRHQEDTARQAEELKATAKRAAEDLRRKSAHVASEAKETARHAADQAMQTAAETAQAAQRRATSFVESQKERLAGELETFGAAFSSAADRLHEGNDQRVASYATMVADELRATSDWLRTRELSDLVGDAENFARRRPEVFFGGMLLLGLGIARFLKASSPPRRRQSLENTNYPHDGYDEFDHDYQYYGEPSRGAYQQLSLVQQEQNSSLNPPYDEPHHRTYEEQVWPESHEPSKLSPMNDPLSYH